MADFPIKIGYQYTLCNSADSRYQYYDSCPQMKYSLRVVGYRLSDFITAGFHLENFPWGGSSLGSSCYVSYTWSIASFSVVPSLACGAVTLACLSQLLPMI